MNQSPEAVVRTMSWIDNVQAHINTCVDDPTDLECILMASALQSRVDQAWDALGPLVADRPRPYSALRSA